MARTKLTSRKTTGGKAKQFASKASGKSANVNSIVKKAALSPSLKTLISVEKITHKQVCNSLKDNTEIDANLQETIYEGKVQILREGHKNCIHFISTLNSQIKWKIDSDSNFCVLLRILTIYIRTVVNTRNMVL